METARGSKREVESQFIVRGSIFMFALGPGLWAIIKLLQIMPRVCLFLSACLTAVFSIV